MKNNDKRRHILTSLCIVASAALLAGCDRDVEAEETAAAERTQLAEPTRGANVPDDAAPEGEVAVRRAAPIAVDSADLPADACAIEIGMTAAEELVRQCQEISPSTRPPCNVANSCQQIRRAITRGCAMGTAETNPDYCAATEE